MPRLRLAEDVRPVTEFRANTAAILDQVHSTGRPVVLTQHGRSTAVLLDVAVYERMLDELAVLRAIRAGEEDVALGRVAEHREVMDGLRRRLER